MPTSLPHTRSNLSAALRVAMTSAAVIVAVAGCGGSSDSGGKELARHTHEGETFALVEYDDRLAVFAESGQPVSGAALVGRSRRGKALLHMED